MEIPDNIPVKLIGGVVGALLLLVGAYVLVFSGDESTAPDDSLQTTSTNPSGLAAQQRGDANTGIVLRQLNELRKISIDTALFNSPAFLSLRDFSVTISPQPIGRENPFIPSDYVPDGASIIPTQNPVQPGPLNDSATNSNNQSTTTDQSATTSTQSQTETNVTGNQSAGN